jgi:hypothetical protein
MELYTLDPLLRREFVVDKFESLIWTERFQQFGDFQLDIVSSYKARSLLKTNTYLALNKSNYVMRIESVEDDVNEDGEKLLIVKGRSLEALLYDRVAYLMNAATQTTTTNPGTGEVTTSDVKWTITGTPAAVCRKIFHDICVVGTLDLNDVIPFINEGTFMPHDTIAEPTDSITVDISPTTVYDAIDQVAQVWDLGFRLLRQVDMSKLWFDIYVGSDRTTAQTVLPAVVFAPEMDNLQNTKELMSIESAKNVAYVYSPAGFQMVFAAGVDPDVEGFERHVLSVDASDITTDSTTDVVAALQQRGYEELAKNRAYQAFDGEISQNSQYVYGRDYNLGDMVETRNIDSVANNMRVTEQIFVEDKEGERSYPTLTLNTFINAGSWLSWTSNKTWFDFDTDLVSVWGNQP